MAAATFYGYPPAAVLAIGVWSRSSIRDKFKPPSVEKLGAHWLAWQGILSDLISQAYSRNSNILSTTFLAGIVSNITFANDNRLLKSHDFQDFWHLSWHPCLAKVLIGLPETDRNLDDRVSTTTFIAVFTSLIILAMQYTEQEATRNVQAELSSPSSNLVNIAVRAIRNDWSSKN